MANLINQKFNRLLVIEKTDQRKSGSIVWKCLCDCGNICYVSTRDLKSGNTKSCGCLNSEKRLFRIQKYNNENKKYFPGDQIGVLTLIEETPFRDNGNIIWKTKCICGKEYYINTSNLKSQSHQRCPHSIPFIYKDLTNKKFGKLTAIKPTYFRQHGNVVWECQCDCGNICYKGSTYLISGVVQSCGCLKSKGEEKISLLLRTNNINFQQQYYFQDCKKDNNYLFFDFFVNNEYVIEYDGIQHFQQTGWEDLSIIQERDNIKNNYCKIHNIPIIRIPYLKLDTLDINDLILKTSDFVI